MHKRRFVTFKLQSYYFFGNISHYQQKKHLFIYTHARRREQSGIFGDNLTHKRHHLPVHRRPAATWRDYLLGHRHRHRAPLPVATVARHNLCKFIGHRSQPLGRLVT